MVHLSTETKIVYLLQRCPTLKTYSPQMWRQELLCRHIYWKYTVARTARIFCFNFLLDLIFSRNFNNPNTFYCINYSLLQIAKYMKFCLSPHLNCLSPHVANGDKVGHRWSTWLHFELREWDNKTRQYIKYHIFVSMLEKSK